MASASASGAIMLEVEYLLAGVPGRCFSVTLKLFVIARRNRVQHNYTST